MQLCLTLQSCDEKWNPCFIMMFETPTDIAKTIELSVTASSNRSFNALQEVEESVEYVCRLGQAPIATSPFSLPS